MNEVANVGYGAMQTETCTALVAIGPVPEKASLRQWFVRNTLTRFAGGSDQAIDLPLVIGMLLDATASWQERRWRTARFILTRVDSKQQIAFDVLDGPEFGISPDSHVAFFLSFEQHFRPLLPIRSSRVFLAPARSNTFLDLVRTRDALNLGSLPLRIIKAEGWGVATRPEPASTSLVPASRFGYIPGAASSTLPTAVMGQSERFASGSGGAANASWSDTCLRNVPIGITDFAERFTELYVGPNAPEPEPGVVESELAEPWMDFSIDDIKAASLSKSESVLAAKYADLASMAAAI